MHQFFRSNWNAHLFHPIFTVFELPHELVLSVLSHISPDPRPTSHYARFGIQHIRGISDSHQQRVQFLRPLSMTCRAMRLQLMPWIWGCLDTTYSQSSWDPAFLGRRLNTLVNALHADAFLATSVKYHCTLILS